MKTLYSSTFLTAIFAFLLLIGQSGQTVILSQDGAIPSFETIIEPVGPQLPSDGPVKVEVFNTFGCEECDRFGSFVLPQLVEKYADSSAVEFRLYLIPDTENEGELYATRGAHCAARFENFWAMVDALHKLETLNRREVDLIGQGLGLPITPFRNCIDSEDFDEQIAVHRDYAVAKKVTEKPTTLVNRTVLLGAQPLENIERIINKYL